MQKMIGENSAAPSPARSETSGKFPPGVSVGSPLRPPSLGQQGVKKPEILPRKSFEDPSSDDDIMLQIEYDSLSNTVLDGDKAKVCIIVMRICWYI